MKKMLLGLILLPCLSNGQVINTFCGNGIAGYSGDGGAATAAKINSPSGSATDAAGNVYISESGSHVIRKISPSGIITTAVGTGVAGYSGDGGAASMAKINNPNKILIDGTGNLYISDFSNNVVRKVSTSGIITTIAGTGMGGYSGDGGPATAANLFQPADIAFDASNNLYIADYVNYRIRKVSTAGIISTYAGSGTAGSLGDGGPATAAQFHFPYRVIFDESDNLFIADAYNNKIRKVTPSGIISTFAGTGTPAFSGDGGPATAAELANPVGIAFDGTGNMYIADDYNNRIRKISTTGIISTFAGTGTAGYFGDGGPASAAQLNEPRDLTIDAAGRMYISDDYNDRVRIISVCIPGFTYQPKDDTVVAGATAKYFVKTIAPAGSYQWQEDPGTGFVDLANVWPYSGVTTDTLTISNVSIYLNATHYRCVVPGASSCSDTSSSAILIVKPPLGQPVLSSESIHIYPNPVTDKVVIESPVALAGSAVSIINTLGQVLMEQKTEKGVNTFDLHSQLAGMYIVKFVNNGSALYQKVIKN